ncbi:hypothetical protein GQ457_06G015020 [Hibiscus cannabinus]
MRIKLGSQPYSDGLQLADGLLVIHLCLKDVKCELSSRNSLFFTATYKPLLTNSCIVEFNMFRFILDLARVIGLNGKVNPSCLQNGLVVHVSCNVGLLILLHSQPTLEPRFYIL